MPPISAGHGFARFRAAVGGYRRDLLWLWGLRGLNARVALFQWRARRLARRTRDAFSLASATRPADLRTLLELSAGRRTVVELGTGTGWTAITLALDDPARRVVSYDVVSRGVERYLRLVGPRVRRRVELVVVEGTIGSPGSEPVDLLYIDSSHDREQTIAEVRAWKPHLRPGAVVLFDDYAHVEYRGVREAVAELALNGEQRGTLFVHKHPN